MPIMLRATPKKKRGPKKIHVLLLARSRHSYCGQHMETAYDRWHKAQGRKR